MFKNSLFLFTLLFCSVIYSTPALAQTPSDKPCDAPLIAVSQTPGVCFDATIQACCTDNSNYSNFLGTQPICGNSPLEKDAWYKIGTMTAGEQYNFLYTESGNRQTWVEIYELPAGKNCADSQNYNPIICTRGNDVSAFKNSTASATFTPMSATSTYYVRFMRTGAALSPLADNLNIEGKICIAKSYPNDEPCGATFLPIQPAKGTNPVVGKNYVAADWKPLVHNGPTCGPNNDVWYKFIPEECSVNIFLKNLTPTTYEIQAAILESVDGTCDNLKAITPCGGEINKYADILLSADGLTVGRTYYVIVDGFSPPYFNATGEHSIEVFKKPNPPLCPNIDTPCDCGKPSCISPSPFPTSAAGNFALTKAKTDPTVSGCFDLKAQNIPVLGGTNKATFCASYTAAPGDDLIAFDNVLHKDANCELLSNLNKNIVFEEGDCNIQIAPTCKDINGTSPVYRLTVGKTYKFCRQAVANGGDLDCVGKNYQAFCAFLWKVNNKSTINKTVCNGETYTFNNTTYSISDTYTIPLPNPVTGCDSVITLNFTVLPVLKSSIKRTVCPEKGFTLGGKTYFTSGIFTEIIKSVNNCDSTVTVDLTVLAAAKSTLTKTVCNKEKVKIGTKEFDKTGVYDVIVPSAKGCDSTVTLNLTVLPPQGKTNNATVCFGGKYTYKGKDFNATGIYELETFKAINGCDSILSLNLTVLPDYSNVKAARTICSGQTLTFGDMILTQAGVFTHSFKSTYQGLGCDSTVTLTLSIENQIETSLKKVLCFGESFKVGDSTYVKTGNYQNVFKAQGNCDSIVKLNLTIRPSVKLFNPDTIKICEGKSTIVDGKVITKDSTIIVNGKYPEGCDSATTKVIVKVIRTTDYNITGFLCNKDVFIFNGKSYPAGIHKDSIKIGDCIEKRFTIIVKQNKKGSVSSTPDICNAKCDGTATATMNDAVAPVTYLWDNGATTKTIENLCEGKYKVTMTDVQGCMVVADTIVSKDAPSFNIKGTTTKTTCEGASNGTIDITEPTTTKHTFLWDNGKTTPNIDGLKAGIYKVTVTNNDGCSTTQSFIIQADKPFEVEINALAKASCNSAKDGAARVTSPLGSNFTYLWTNGETSPVNTTLMAGNQSVTVTDTNSKCSAVGTVSIGANATTVTISATPPNVTIAEGQSVSIELKSNANPVTYTWSPSTTSGTSPYILTPKTTTLYTVTATDSKGCTNTATVNIVVKKIIFPSIFTPESGGDGNNIFKPYPEVPNDNIEQVQIFDRWGNLVYSWKAAEEEWWNGKFNNKGADLASDVYIYYVKIVGYNTPFKGDITLIR